MEALVYLNALFNVFTEGTYPVRPFLFVTFLLCLFVAAFAARHGLALPHRAQRGAGVLVLVSVAALFMGNAVAQVSILTTHGIAPATPTYFIDASGITGTRLSHNHLGKAIIGTMADSVPRTFSSADTGAPLKSFLPHQLVFVELFLFLAALVGSIALFPALSGGVLGKERRLAFFFLYGLTSFIVLEKAVDGGILSDAAPLASAVFMLLLLVPGSFRRTLPYAFGAYAIIVAIGLSLDVYRESGYFFNSIEKALVYAAFAFALSYIISGTSRRMAVVLLLAAFALCAAKAYPTVVSWQAYSTAPAAPSEGYILSDKPLPGLAPIATLGAARFYDIPTTTTPGELSARYSLPLWLRPVAPRGTQCSSPSLEYVSYFILLVPAPVATTTFHVPSIGDLALLPVGRDPSGWEAYRGKLALNPCVPDQDYSIKEFILRTGAPRAIIFSLLNYRVLAR